MHKSTIAFRLLEQMTNKVPKMRFTTSAQIAAILLLAAGLFSSCEMPKTKKATTIDSYDYGKTQIIEIDSCQYILHIGYKETAITHKGNCKYCLTRKK
jgi:hypothetical protein